MDSAPILVDPPHEKWRPTTHVAADNETIGTLAGHAALAGRLVIATGHQPWLWHPGILAKDIAADHFARTIGAASFHIVVDHDPLKELRLEVPAIRGSQLRAETVVLYRCPPHVPPASLPPADIGQILTALTQARRVLERELAVDVTPILAAWEGLPTSRTLAEQLSHVLSLMRAPFMPTIPIVFASTLHTLPAFRDMVAQMRDDPIRNATLYNAAVAAHADVQVPPLQIRADRVELPVWALQWQRPRKRVHVETDSGRLVTETGQPLPDDGRRAILAPRALAMTALLRNACCNLFIHGTGGDRYDRITDQWWASWQGTPLAPRALVTTDLRMPFEIPVASPEQLAAALWKVHHLPHNLDRALGLSNPVIERKRLLIQTMEADRDRRRRAAAFDEIHQINAALSRRHAATIKSANQEVARTRNALKNLEIAHRRDWCFALYDAVQLGAHADAIRAMVDPGLDTRT